MSAPTYTIDGATFATLQGFFDCVERELIPGASFFGRNLDALNDVLGGGLGDLPEAFTLVWVNVERSRVALGYPETVAALEAKLIHCHPSNRELVASELSAARRGEGPTVFDWLVEAVRRQPGITLVLQ